MSVKLNNATLSEPKAIADDFCDYFANFGKKCFDNISPSRKHFTTFTGDRIRSLFFLSPVTPGDIIYIINTLKSTKSAGHDNIPSSLIKSLKGETAFCLSVLINASLATGEVPDMHKAAKVIPLYKAHDATGWTNYHPIPLLPSVSKILEKIVHKIIYISWTA